MAIRVVLELINVDVLAIAIRVTVGKHHANVWVLVERLGLFFGHFHPLSFHASVVVSDQLIEYCATNNEEPIVCDNILDFGTYFVVSCGNGVSYTRFTSSSYLNPCFRKL